MLVRAVPRIHYRNAEALGYEFRGARRAVANHDSIGAQGFQSPYGVEQRFAFFQAGGLGLQIHGVRTEASRGGGKTNAGARGVLEKRQGHSLAAQSG